MSDRNKALLLAFVSGLLSLGMEIVWTRLVSFTHHTVPQSFAYVLFCYLLGIALGAHLGKKACNRSRGDANVLWRVVGQSLIWSAAFDVVAISFYAAAWMHPYFDAFYLFVVITLSAAIKGVIFPIVHYIGSLKSDEELGASISNIYAANVAGATIGPLFVGFVLMNIATLQQAMLVCALAAIIVWACVSRQATGAKHQILAGVTAVVILGALGVADKHLLIRELVAREDGSSAKIEFINESRHGTIHAIRDSDGDLVVHGENLYDGKINTSLTHDVNGLFRVYALTAMHHNPKRVLVIGLSGGSWVEVLRHFPGVDSIDVVEINPNYLKLVKSQPEVAPLLDDPRVKIHITDGRKYIRQHHEKYDLIVMNTTWHWRAYSALLLGQDFLSSLRGSLNSGGVIAFNTTSSMDVFYTAAQVFPFAGLYSNFVFASDHDIRPQLKQNAARIYQVAMAVAGPSANATAIAEAANRTANREIQLVSEVKFERPPEVVTERNMITEYKYGMPFIH
ncbi:MAG: fused MFS/spermidine synthase [Burkholderiaceae bacterium]|nr:fused MFS/spermidine synthase [Burkholderiaceae bacterium]